MVFEHLTEPDDGQLLKSRYACKYLEYSMIMLGLRAPPTENRFTKHLYRLWSMLILWILEIYLPIAFILPFIWSFDTISSNELMSSLAMFFNIPTLSIKILILLANIWRVDKMKEMLDIMYERCVSVKERLQVQAFTNKCITCSKIYLFAYVMSLNLMYLSSMLSGHAPYNLYNPFVDWRQSTKNLWIASTIEYVVVLLAVCCNVVLDCMPLIFMMTIRGHIKLIIQRVEALRMNADFSEQENFEQLVLCIKDHKMILEYCANMRPLISSSLFVQFTAIGFITASTVINLLFFSNFLTGLSSAWYMMACSMQSFPTCYTCDLIIKDCEDLGMTIFHANWFNANQRYKMALVYFMQNVQQPIEFVGLGVLPISLATYGRMIKIAFSLLTCVRQMNLIEGVQ